MTAWLMNAAGTVKTPDKVAELALVPSLTHIVIGSYTVAPRDGRNIFRLLPDGASFNRMGLPNKGLPWLLETLDAFKIVAGDKRLVISIAGGSIDDYQRQYEALKSRSHEYQIEVDAACPAVAPPPLAAIGAWLPRDCWLKVAPNQPDWDALALWLRGLQVQTVVAVNSWAGIGGSAALHMHAIGAVSALVRAGIPQVIGVGGVRDQLTRQNFIDAGCVGVQVATAYLANGPEIFDVIGAK